jgi:hypothetical protein
MKARKGRASRYDVTAAEIAKRVSLNLQATGKTAARIAR